MNAKALVSLFAAAALTLHAHAASGQYAPRPGGPGTEAAWGPGAGGHPAGLGLAFATHLEGEALLLSEDDQDWVALSPNLSLRVGDRVWVQDDSRLEIRFPLGATAWVSYRSELDVTRLESASRSDTVQLALVSGEASFDVTGFTRAGSVFQVDLPDASIRAFRAARFRVNTLPDGTAQVGVVDGTIMLETPDGFTNVSAGQMAEVQPDRRMFLDFLPAEDDWDRWVWSRAQRYDRPAASGRYLPAELVPYAHEFDTSGRWVRDPAHGYVWVPAVAPGWSPYSNGRWVWQAGDYVWLPYDPWYAPFHYGRWSWAVSIGWFWIVPKGRAYWSPGYVGWSIVGDDVGWVPLGPGETYYGYGDYGPASVNVSVNATINVTNVYVNSRVSNGVVVVRRDNFLRGRIRDHRIAPSRNPFERRGARGLDVIARPPVREIRPIRETRQARPEVEVKRVSLPPVRLEKRSRDVRQRSVAPAETKSVYKKGGSAAPLRNIQREKDLEKWAPPKKAPAPRPAKIAPPPQEPVKKGVITRKTQTPTGKRRFKRVPEPEGGAGVAPPPTVAPKERTKGQGGEQPPGKARRKGGDR